MSKTAVHQNQSKIDDKQTLVFSVEALLGLNSLTRQLVYVFICGGKNILQTRRTKRFSISVIKSQKLQPDA